MGINLGATTISNLKLGGTQVSKVYLGSTEVWSNSTPPTPVVPDYGTVTLYGFTIPQTTLSNVVGGTVTVTDEQMFSNAFSDWGSHSAPIDVTIEATDIDDPGTWTIDAYDSSSQQIWVDGWQASDCMTIVPSDPQANPITVSFTIDVLGGAPVIDKTTTTTLTLSSATEFDSLINNNGMTLSSTVPIEAVKEVVVGRLITSTPIAFLGEFSNLDTVDLSGATSLMSIGNAFLTYCNSFNSTITLPEGITQIGGTFLAGCSAFNQPITLPSTLTVIGRSFLAHCSAFNQPITLPSNITSIGHGFLSMANSMTSAVDVGSLSATVLEADRTETDYHSFTGNSATAATYTTGVPIKGSTRAQWISRFPDYAGPGWFRNLEDGGA